MDTMRATVLKELQQALITISVENKPVQSLVVALSGGKDSVVMLDILACLANDNTVFATELPSLYAYHVNHGLSADADDWEQHCANLCAHRDISFQSISISIAHKSRTSLEAQARELRYRRLLEFTKQVDGALITAHHLHDQVETVLLQLKRGAGPKGLAGMQPLSYREQVPIIRPMLNVSQDAVNRYALTKKLSWVKDASNQDERFERNFLRQTIIPQLETRWPSLSSAISRSARFCYEQALLLEQETTTKLGAVQDGSNRLTIAALLEHGELWQKQILREWLKQFFPLSPSASVLMQIQQMLTAREDSQPLVEIGEFAIRRFKGQLWCTPQFKYLPEQMRFSENGVTLPLWGTKLTTGSERPSSTLLKRIRLVTGMPAIKIKPVNKAHHKLFKEWLKEWEVPPWERLHIPIIFFEEMPIAVCLHDKIMALQTPADIPAIDFIYK
ncbi:tRNA lysidine(34) synthetase TilS [Alteromonas ponticola]|uniref:tRNA(Ile)-lysidine synthase n=1 Tax=Alteromonas ponticola TaxID=2720613 RepID=A0ABX1R372_9ALTE|nr:tRNA lysidine(34) synthetase TilS [Alteromonas ponticola]NMH59698.1 tRNA lysidine(34) synthetase TilS [Alteromonas ponticola]